MEGEKLFTQSKEVKKENPLLKGPDSIDSTIEKEMKSMDFGFSSDNRRYLLQHTVDGSKITVECYDSLPEDLTPQEKAKFRKMRAIREGVERDVYFLSSTGEIQENEKLTKGPKEYYIAERRDFQTNGFRNFLLNNDNRRILAEIIGNHTSFDQARAREIADIIFDAEQSGDEELRSKNIGLLDRESFEKMRIDVMANIEMPKPAEMTLESLAENLKGKKVLFYTGAGISKESGVHDMEELKSMLQIDQSQACDGFLKIAADDPQKAAALWEQFTHVAHNNEPTSAHIAMTEIAKQLQCKIFTENVDTLHEKTGIQALRPTGDWLKENIQKEWLNDIDIVITAGLSTDDRGFLAWYKENNPNGKILAINLEQPRYLGNEDFLLKGNAQEILPTLKERIFQSEEMKLLNKTESWVVDLLEKVENHNDIRHAKQTMYWVKQLKSNADEALLIAAVAHDIERAVYGDWKAGSDDPEALCKHQDLSAAEIEKFLRSEDVADETIERVKYLVANHEVGGDEDQNVLCDADVLSFFEDKAVRRVKKWKEQRKTKEEMRKNMDYYFSRIITSKAKEIAKQWYDEAVEEIEK